MNINVCVMCGSSENLNTSMTINVDNKQITVKICDTDAETATPKVVKDHYLAKKSEIEEIIAKAQALGLDINLPDDPDSIAVARFRDHSEKSEPATIPGPVLGQEMPPDPMQPNLDSAIAAAVEGSEKEGVLSTRTVDSVVQRVQSAAGGETGAESHAAYVPGAGEDKLDPTLLEGKVRMEGAQGRGGQPIAVPAVRVDQTGTTTVRVKQDVDDNILQQRFKELAHSTGADGANKHSFAKAGYDVHNCPICKGDGMVKQRGKLDTCPKCKGSGLLNS